MSKRKYAIGVDFSTESGRAVLVDVSNGGEIGEAKLVHPLVLGHEFEIATSNHRRRT
jgi:ribulose kinase